MRNSLDVWRSGCDPSAMNVCTPVSYRSEIGLLISAGNTSNAELEALLLRRFSELIAARADSDFVELDRDNLIIHK
jgi:hypothetical protein